MFEQANYWKGKSDQSCDRVRELAETKDGIVFMFQYEEQFFQPVFLATHIQQLPPPAQR